MWSVSCPWLEESDDSNKPLSSYHFIFLSCWVWEGRVVYTTWKDGASSSVQQEHTSLVYVVCIVAKVGEISGLKFTGNIL